MPKLKTLKPRLSSLDTRTVRPPEQDWTHRKATEPFQSFYSSTDWKQFRDAVIAERGKRCEMAGCGATPGRVYLDHVRELKDGGSPLDRGNVMVLCPSCHTKKTNRARMARWCESC